MANDVITYVEEILKNEQYLAALDKAYKREEALKTLRHMGGQTAVKAWQDTEKAAAKAAVAEERAAKGPSAWTQALTANTAAVEASAKELTDLRGQINLGAESLGKLGGALSLISPELATLTGGLQKVTGVFSAGASGAQLLGSGLTAAASAAGVVALAASPLILLWKDVADAQEAAAAAAKVWNELQDDGLPLIEASKAAVKELALELSPLSKVEKERTTIAEKWQGQLKTVNAATQAQIDLINAQLAGGEALDKINAQRVARGEEELSQIRKTGPQIAASLELRKRLEGELKANAAAAAEGFEAERKLADIRREDDEITRRLDQAEKDLEASRKSGTKATEEAYRDAIAYLAKEEAAEKQYFENLGAAQEARDRATEERRLKELADYNAMLKAMGDADARALDEEEARHNEAMEKRKAEDEQRVAAVESFAGASSDLFSALMESNREAAEAGSKSAQEAMLRQFEAQRAAGIGEAVINTAVAVTKASTVAPPPFNIAAMLAAGAAGAAEITTIASQQPPTFTDTPAGGYRFTGESNTIQGAANDTAILFRDPLEGFQQALDVLSRRQAPTSTPARGGRDLIGKQTVMTPVSRLLTRDVERVTRGRI